MAGRRREYGEGTLFNREIKRKDGSVRVRYGFALQVDGKRIQRLFATKAARDAALLEERHEVSQGQPLAKSTPLAVFLEAWLDTVAKVKVGPTTYDQYAHYTRKHIIPALGKTRLDRLSPAEVQRFLKATLDSGAAPRTANHCRAILRNALNVAIKWGLISRNAAELADPAHVPEVEHVRLTVDQAAKLLTRMRLHRYGPLAITALATGLRLSELLGITWDDLDLENGTLTLRHQLRRRNGEYSIVELKVKKSRRVLPLVPHVVAMLSQLREDWERERDECGNDWEKAWNLVFTSGFGRPISRHVPSYMLKQWAKESGIDGMRFHDLRGSLGTFLVTLKVHPRVAMAILGHRQISTTMEIYATALAEDQKEALEAVGALLFPGNTPATHVLEDETRPEKEST